MIKLTRVFSMLLLLGLLPGTSCGTPPGPRPGERIDCNGESRVALDCSSEVDYQGVKGEAGVSIMDVVGVEGSYEDKAIRRVSEQIQQFIAVQTRACRDYNACVVDAEGYRQEATEIRKKLTILPALTEAIKNAKTERERTKAMDQLYRTIVPQEQRVEELTFSLTLHTRLPQELGGGSYVLAPGGMAPTDARIFFTVDASKDAYLYMFQTTPQGEITVLFPNPKIGTRNPLQSAVPARIPDSTQAFRVNEKDVGTEHIYFVVSLKPVANLSAALEKVKSGQVTSVSQDTLLKSVSTLSSGAPETCKTRSLELVSESSACVSPRGLELEDEAPAAGLNEPSAPVSIMVRSAPGDDMIIRVFNFEHTTKEAYQQAGPDKLKTRGIVVED